METVTDFIFLDCKITVFSCKVTVALKLKDTCSLKKSNDKPQQHIKKQRYYFAYEGLYS